MNDGLPDPKGGCACTPHWENHGAGYTEFLTQYEPACPEHSEHLYDPRAGRWIFREPHKDRDWWRGHAEALEVDRARLRAAITEFADQLALPFPDGVPDREGEAIAADLRKILDGGF